MITSKPTPLSDLPSERRREIIANEVRTNATTPYSGTDGKLCLPLFDHPGIRDNTFLQQEITRIATEYVDMLLLQDNAQARNTEWAPIHTQIKRELVTWSTHAFDLLVSLFSSNEISTDLNLSKVTDEAPKDYAHDMLAAIIKLSLVTKSKMNTKRYYPGDVPSAFGLESVADYRESSIDTYSLCLAKNTLLTEYAKKELDDIKAAVRNSEIPVQSFISTNKQSPRAK